jgi:Protein of unknown function (DUF993)
MNIILPNLTGVLEPYRLVGKALPVTAPTKPFNRIAFAAAHVVADPMQGGIDWEATLSYRRHLLGLGFNIAEAMDTSQRGMGLDWPTALELIKRSLADAVEPTRIYSGCGTDHLQPTDDVTLDDVVGAYLLQLHAIQKLGGRIILMASRALARIAKGSDDYAYVYSRVLQEADYPVILHWLGEMFDPALPRYWGGEGFSAAMRSCLYIINDNSAKVDGIKISLLDADKEISFRRALPVSIKMYTGDDFNYPDLIAGDANGFSHALLGIFAAIGPAASLALSALAAGDRATYDRLMLPTVPLSRAIFQTPTMHYKTGIVFLAWLNGHQSHFVMVKGAQSQRSITHFSEVFRLADQAGLLAQPDLAIARMKTLLALHGA